MAISDGSKTYAALQPATSSTAPSLTARIERLPKWSLPPTFMVVLGLGMFYVQYDIFNINVSFSQTCSQIINGCTPSHDVGYVSFCILMSLIGYAVGALGLGWAADRSGRHPVLIVSMIVTGVGCLLSAVAWDLTSFASSRFVTGIGIGADLAIINTYVNEVAPRAIRARMTSALFLLAGVGGAVAIWVGLLLTTPATPWPHGLPFAMASETFQAGWRWIYAIGAALAILSVLLRVNLPESGRWLISQGRLAEAEVVVAKMESRAGRRGPLPDPDGASVAEAPVSGGSYRQVLSVLKTPTYRRRFVVISLGWMLSYVTLYSFGSAFAPVLAGVGFAPTEAGVISSVGIIGIIVAAAFAIFFGDRVERKYWMLIGSAITVVGALAVGVYGDTPWIVFPGAIVLFFGQNIWVGPQYALTAESFPTRTRATSYALCDSIGHVGGGLGVFVIADAVQRIGALPALLALAGFLVAGAAVNLMAPKTRGLALEDVSA